MDEEAAQFCLIMQLLNLPDAVTLEPETAQACVLLQTLNYSKPCHTAWTWLYLECSKVET